MPLGNPGWPGGLDHQLEPFLRFLRRKIERFRQGFPAGNEDGPILGHNESNIVSMFAKFALDMYTDQKLET